MSRPDPPDRRRARLFRRPDGTPIDFHLGGVPYSERQRLAELVRAHGGVVVVNPGRHPHSVSIEQGEPGSRQRPAISIQADVFSSRFLEDCIQQGRLVPLASYRLQSTSVYSQPSRADEVMLGSVTWTQLAAVAFPASLEDEEELNEDERLLAVNEEDDTSSGRGAGPYRGRLKFNRAKDEALIAFVAKYGRQRYAPPTGPKFWHMKKFLLPEILAKHPPLSLHTHFIKQVKPRLADFKCTLPLEVVARAAEAASTHLDLTEAERRQMAEADERESRRAQERLAREREEREERIRAERERVRMRRDERLREERERERLGDDGEDGAEAGAGASAAAAAPEATAAPGPVTAASAPAAANTASTVTEDRATTATDTASAAPADTASQDAASQASRDPAGQDVDPATTPAAASAAPGTATDPPAAASAVSQRTTRQDHARQDRAAAAAAPDAAPGNASEDSGTTNMSSSESHVSASQSDHSDGGGGGGGGRVPMLSRHVSSNHSDELGDSDETVEIPPQIRQSMTARLSAILSQSGGGGGEENYSPILPSQAQPKKRAQCKRRLPDRLLDTSDEESVVSVGPRSGRRAAGAAGVTEGVEAHAAWAGVAEELHGRVSVTPNEDGTVTVTVIGTIEKDAGSRGTEDAGDSAAAPRQSPRKGAKRTAAASPQKRGTVAASPDRRGTAGASPQRRGAAARSPEKRGTRRAAAVRANESLSPAYGGTLLDGHGTEQETRAGDMMKFLRNFRLRRELRGGKNRAEGGVETSTPAAAATGKDGGSPTRRGLRSAATTATTAAATAGVDTPRSPSESSAVSVDISPTVKLTRVDAENAATSNGATGGCDRPAPRGAGAGTPEPEQRSAPVAAEAAGAEGAGLDRTRASSGRRRLYDHDTPGRILEVSPQNRAEPRGEPRGAMPTPGAAPTATSTQTTPPRRPKPLADWLRDHSISTPEAASVEEFPPMRLDRHTRATAAASATVAAATSVDDGGRVSAAVAANRADADDEGRAVGQRISHNRAAAADNRRIAAESRATADSRAAQSRAAADRQEAGPSRLPGKRRRRRRAPSPDADKDSSSSDSEAGSVNGPVKRRAARRARTNIAATINSTNSFTNAVSSTTTNGVGVGGKRSRPPVVQKKPNGRPVGCNARPYTPEEDRVLWTQVEAIEAAGGLLGGNVVWKKMERTRVIPGRSWQSLKQRWRLLSHRV